MKESKKTKRERGKNEKGTITSYRISVSNGTLHIGQVLARATHRPRHFSWKECWQIEVKAAISPSLNCERHIPHPFTVTSNSVIFNLIRPSAVFLRRAISIRPTSDMLSLGLDGFGVDTLSKGGARGEIGFAGPSTS